MSDRVVVASQKGGVGKTTVCLNLGVALAESGKRTLIVDLDPQGAIGLALARGETEWLGLADHLTGQAGLDQIVVQTKLPALSLLPRGRLNPLDVTTYEAALAQPEGLAPLLNAVERDFEYLILDTPSGLGRITRAALSTCEFVLVPFQAEPLALRSVSQLLLLIDHIQGSDNPCLKMLGFCPTMVELSKEGSLDVMKELWAGFSGVLDTAIPRSDAITLASSEGLPLSHLGGRLWPEARRFTLLAVEIENRIRDLGPEQGEEDERPRRELV